MFWKFGGYANVSPIDAILDRQDFTLEELLDESELLGDIKAHNSKLLEYLRQRDVIDRLLDFVVAPKLEPVAVPEKEESEPAADTTVERGRSRLLPFGRSRASSSATDGGRDEEDDAEKKRNKYAFVACEILSSDNWSISETLMTPSNRDLLLKFWQFLKRPAPLDPLQASYFTKVNESLFDKKVDEMVEFLKSAENAVQDMLRHVDCPNVMDLLLKIITLDRPEASQGIVEWLYTQDIMPTLLSFLNPENSWATQTSAGDFIKAIITVSANATQHEQTCIGPNELTRQLVSHPCIDELIGYMLKGGNALTVGVGIVIEVIRKNNSDYDPDVGTEANSLPSSRDPIYLGTLLRMFAQNVPNFMHLMNNAPAQKSRLNSTFGEKIEPLGFDRFKTCELMAELLHCSNMGLLNEVGSEELIAARDAERKRLRSEGKLTPNRGEEPTPSGTDLLTMRISHSSPADEGRRLEVTNVSAADDDGFEEVTHAAGLGEEGNPNSQQSQQNQFSQESALPSNGPTSASEAFMEKDEDDFVEEPLSSPRLKTHDDELDDAHFNDPDLLVAPLSPSKKKGTSTAVAGQANAGSDAKSAPSAKAATKDELTEGSDDFVTEATEPALGEEAKRMVPDLEKGDDSDSSIMFTPTISSLSESLEAQSLRRSPSPTSESSEHAKEPSSTVEHREDTTAAEQKTETPTSTSNSQAAEHSATSGALGEGVSKESSAQEEKGDKHEPEAPQADATLEKEAGKDDTVEQGDASIIVAHQAHAEESNEPAADARFSDPVVGDFLKMQFVDHRVVPTILSFFFSYPWNNFLHNVVYDVVQQVFNGPMDRGFNPHLAISLFESADITTQIINGQLVSEQSQASTRMRMGYMGHLTLIAEEVVKFTERHPPELLSEMVLDKVMSQDWINYVEGPLAETRERDNAILGGVRPEVAMGNQAAAAGLAAVGLSSLGSSFGLPGSQNTSSALADAGLNGVLDLQSGFDMQGGNEGAPGPFSISAGISSGFHSSSDEEDDDADDNDEDINNEFRAYTDPMNASSSLIPPAIPPPPPPPPPLNIPPSRARRQLAARLAMNKRNAEAAAAEESGRQVEEGGSSSSSGNGGAGGDGTGEAAEASNGGDLSLLSGPDSGSKSLSGAMQSGDSERLRNPFADDEEDDVDVDEDDDEEVGLTGGDVGRVGMGWNRGGWWRSMVLRDRNNTSNDSGGLDNEKFGDGRDSSSGGSSDEEGDGHGRRRRGQDDDENDEDEDEEFGDFAMPEASKEGATDANGGKNDKAEEGSSGSSSNGVGGLFFDRDREQVLFKPLAVHPSANSGASGSSSSNNNAGSGLWPFERLGFLTNPNNGAGKDESKTEESGDASRDSEDKGVSAASATAAPTHADDEDELEVISEDGHRVARVTEAKRRTSLEDPDEDEVVV